MGEKNLASSAQLPTRIVIRTQYTGCLYVRQLRWVHRKWPAVRKQSVGTMVPHVPRMNGVRWRRRRLRVERCCLPDSEATLGRHVDAALAATQSTPGILGINVKSRPLGQHARWPSHIRPTESIVSQNLHHNRVRGLAHTTETWSVADGRLEILDPLTRGWMERYRRSACRRWSESLSRPD